MAAVIRIKRRLEDEPLETLILNCKRRKIDSGDEDNESELPTLLKLAGTVKSQEDIHAHLEKSSKVELEEKFKKHTTDLTSKLRIQKQQDSKKNRYKVVNLHRSQSCHPGKESAESLQSDYMIYDLETEVDETQPTSSDTDSRFVYDLYYTNLDNLGDADLEEYVSLYPWIHSKRDHGLNEKDSDDESMDSNDSNAEGYYRNDYPDEFFSDEDSVAEDDMVDKMNRCDLDDLSSDYEEEGFVYSRDDKAAGFDEDNDEESDEESDEDCEDSEDSDDSDSDSDEEEVFW